MKNRSVVKLLASLGQRNINSLDSYLHSFYGNQECVLLFDTIKEYAPKFSSKKMQEELVWKRCFPSKKLTTNRIDKLCSTLHGHVKEFMAWQEMKDDAVLREKLFLKATSRYELKEDFEDTLERLVSLIKDEKNTEIWRHEALIEVYHQQYFSISLMRKKDKGKQAFINVIENLDTFYLTYRTLLEAEKRNREYVVIEEFEEFNFEEIRNLLKNTHSKSQASSLMQTLEFFSNKELRKDATLYNVLEEKVFGLMPSLYISDQEIILNFLAVVANYYFKQGKNEFLHKIFKILKYGVENGSSIKNNSISHMFFINVIDVACKTKEIEWAEIFCKNYQHFLSKEVKAETVRLSEGCIAYVKKDFQKAQRILEGRGFNIYGHNARSRWTLIMMYYDTGNDKLLNECEAFAQVLYREKLYTETGKRGRLNFLKAIDMLRNPNVNKKDIMTFIETCKFISQKMWLDEKIKERKF